MRSHERDCARRDLVTKKRPIPHIGGASDDDCGVHDFLGLAGDYDPGAGASWARVWARGWISVGRTSMDDVSAFRRASRALARSKDETKWLTSSSDRRWRGEKAPGPSGISRLSSF